VNIAIIDYKAGNVKSVEAALQRLNCQAYLTKDHEKILSADKVVFPGVGNAGAAMQALKKEGLDILIPKLKQPVLGICLGMQLMCRHSEEEDTPGLNIFDAEVKKFVPENGEKIPHMGWNNIFNLKMPLYQGVKENSYVYFVSVIWFPCLNIRRPSVVMLKIFRHRLLKIIFTEHSFTPKKADQ